MADQLDTLLSEQRRFPPSAAFASAANGKAGLYQAAERDREGFWAEQAQLIDWHRPFQKVLDYSTPPFARWFVGGETNLCHNAVDRHLGARGDQTGGRAAAARRWSSNR